jgi:hypothetical protein
MVREAQGSSDYDRERKSTEWDSMELYHILWALE